jgi:NAD(P)-dependent dehydrogenase (short-subunit alcohol dehydrogenase family)
MSVAIVTGASQGFGRALAVDLAKDGWSLVIDGRRSRPLEEVARALEGLGAPVRSIPGDVTDSDHRSALVASAEELGGLDLLVNNASTLGPSPMPHLLHYPLDAIERVFGVNVFAPLALLQLALPQLARAQGTVVSISSDAAVEAYEGWGGYGSSKAALDQIHRVLAVEQPEVTVYLFDPGDMRPEMHQAAFPGEDISDRPDPESVVPALRRLLDSGATSGRYRAGQGVQP